MMNGWVLIELCIGGELSNFDHLADLFVADELLVNFFQLFLEDEVLGVFKYLFAV